MDDSGKAAIAAFSPGADQSYVLHTDGSVGNVHQKAPRQSRTASMNDPKAIAHREKAMVRMDDIIQLSPYVRNEITMMKLLCGTQPSQCDVASDEPDPHPLEDATLLKPLSGVYGREARS